MTREALLLAIEPIQWVAISALGIAVVVLIVAGALLVLKR